jgi:hypothetical protein
MPLLRDWLRSYRNRRHVRPWALSVPVVVLLIALPLLRPLRHPDPQAMSDDERARLATVQSLVENKTLAIDESVSLTATLEILRVISLGRGPQRVFMALGYSGWAAGQIEEEIAANGWLTCNADSGLIFDHDQGPKYTRALRSVAAAGTDRNVLTRRLAGFGPSAVTLVAPSVIVSGLEVRAAEEGGEKPPLLPRP